MPCPSSVTFAGAWLWRGAEVCGALMFSTRYRPEPSLPRWARAAQVLRISEEVPHEKAIDELEETIQPRRQEDGRQRHAASQAGDVEVRQGAPPQGQEPQTGDRHRAVRGTEERRQGPAQEAMTSAAARGAAERQPLGAYRKKRRFSVTSEPKGRIVRRRRAEAALAFVVQKHRATALHYDFRLEWKGVMLSWAVPKGPSTDPKIKRMAMRVEDHPIEYNRFEGTIPPGEYGGGTVMLWDRGAWTPESADVDAALKAGSLKLSLAGEKLHGAWVLVRTRPVGKKAREAWLLIKRRDRWASARDVARPAPRSMASNRLLAEIARDAG